MNLKTQKTFYAVLIVLLLIIIGTSVYSLLGGFEDPMISYQDGDRLSIVGKYFKGYYAHPDLEKLWNESRQRIEDGEIPGQLAVVSYTNDSLANDEVEQFVGVAIEGGMAEVPSDYEVLEISMSPCVDVSLTMHPIVRPRPHKIVKMLEDFASTHGYQLAPYTVELYARDNTMHVQAPIRSIE